MTSVVRGTCRYLGRLHGHGSLTLDDGVAHRGVAFEMDGYADGAMRWANGQIEGDPILLSRAFAAGSATLASADGVALDIVLSDPTGTQAAGFDVRGGFPL